MLKTSLEYIKNNQLTPIEQPYNSIVKVEPVVLGNYTFNNSAYPSIDETSVINNEAFKSNDTLIGNLVGESDKIVNFEITVAIDSPEYISNSMDTTIVLSKRYASLSLDMNPIYPTFVCYYEINGGNANIVTVDTTGLTYLECCMSIIDAINDQYFHNTILRYKDVILENGSVILKIIVPIGINLKLDFDDKMLSYENGYIYNNNPKGYKDVMTVPLDVNNTNNVINYSTLNDGSFLYINLTNYVQSDKTKYSTTIVQTTTVI